jgi:tRNA nucleotidyltransferase (CCA-adding enzyme)
MTAAHDLFFLAHYAYNTLNPLVEEAKAIDPSVQLGLDVTFGHEAAAYTKAHKVTVEVHWGREGMLARSTNLKTKTDVDLFADVLRGKVGKLKAPATEERRNPWTEVLEPVSL